MSNLIRWGIIATGKIANKFAKQFKRVKNGELLGVGSRHNETAYEFGNKYNILRPYGSYQELVNDPDIDAVYIATPHSLHYENTIMSLNAGKHVLCEKPFSINHTQAKEMIDLAREKNLFLMEAVWMRFNKAIVHIRELLKKNTIGEVIGIKADFGFYAPFDPYGRLFNPELGGGALLDIGIYPISLAHMILGSPDNIKSACYKGKTGVDEQNVIIFEYKSGAIAQLSSSLRSDTDHEAYIFGTKGKIKLTSAWHRCLKIILSIRDQEDELIYFSKKNQGLNFETQHMIDCINNGIKESDIMPLDETLSTMKIMDELRSQWNLKYPME